MKRFLYDVLDVPGLLSIAILVVVLVAAFVPPVAAATPEPVEACQAIGSAEGQQLYICETNYVTCVWDPSPTLGAGVVDCDW